MQDLEQIYKQYFETVNKYLFCLTHNNDISEELTQETFYRAVKNINKFKGNCKMSVWLCQIAKNLWYDELKKKKRFKDIDEEDVLLSEINIEDYKYTAFRVDGIDVVSRSNLYKYYIKGNLYEEIMDYFDIMSARFKKKGIQPAKADGINGNDNYYIFNNKKRIKINKQSKTIS